MPNGGGTPEIWTAGVDWLTATANGGVSRVNLLEYGRQMVREEQRNGNRIKAGAPQGYTGFGAGGCFVGERRDGVMLRLSGSLADGAWADAVARSSNVSRIDLQVTIVGDTKLHNLARRHHAEIRRSVRGTGRPISTALLTKDGTPQTLNLGSRSSDVYCRCYDKHAESPEDYPPGAWRYEVEYKGDTAGVVASRLADTDLPNSRALSLVHRDFSKRGAVPVFASQAPAPGTKWDVPITDKERVLKWLRTGVAPTLRRAQVEGWLPEALEALTGTVPALYRHFSPDVK